MDLHRETSYTIPLGSRILTRSPDHYTPTLQSGYYADVLEHRQFTNTNPHQPSWFDALQDLDRTGLSRNQIRELITPGSPAQMALRVLSRLPTESLAFLNSAPWPMPLGRCWPRTGQAILSPRSSPMATIDSYGSRSSVSTLSSGHDASLRGSMTSSLPFSFNDTHICPACSSARETPFSNGTGFFDNLREPHESPTIDTNVFNDAVCNGEHPPRPPLQPQYNPFNVTPITSPIKSLSDYDANALIPQTMNYRSSPIQASPISPVQKKLLHLPCAEENCKHTYQRVEELKKHVEGVHDQDTTYYCIHQGCNLLYLRSDHAKRHHTEMHRDDGCIGEGSCIQSICEQRKRYWGCSLCVTVLKDLTSYVNHWKDHMIQLGGNKETASYSTMILGLLQQEATKDHWENRVQTEQCDLIWYSPTCTAIRRALEFGIYKGGDISLGMPGLVEDLLEDIMAEGKSWMSG
ncbi:hypothetical protein H2204_003846 [Knufia peltigerae]|uniref:C2H2-type domain-containing protein n=1 Tax=Knufia peltigerae TaxID=1002370 RepID=A0AA38Y8V8_9EURO|nr:hypothetical protein H2204_003846 [Knufia peltigerae]